MPTRVDLAVCAIFKNEARYLSEWLEFHHLVGVRRFFLYDNGSTDDWRAAIADSGVGARVTVLDCPGPTRQLPAYADCLARFGDAARWIAFIDLDEFLFAPDGDLPARIEAYRDHPAVAVNWMVFGSSGHELRPPGLVTKAYRRRADAAFAIPQPTFLKSPGLDPDRLESYHPMSAHVKVVLQPALALRPMTPHHFRYRDGRLAVTENGEPFDGPWSPRVSVERLRINHYWSKSRQDLVEKVRRGYACAGTGPGLELAEAIERFLNQKEDTTILPLAQRLRRWDGGAGVSR
ncbi:glycosyltransferase family 92 protein [Stella sp.]|uniref:glycosyltransferase family 92 protein n=1 Tax=Stella sp. TaxID=2912054 RepID=UPI0035B245F5